MTSKKVSKRILGAGIILTGVVILGAALIIGLQFPDVVSDGNIHDICILNANHDRYLYWVHDSFRDKYNRIYYWHITNKEDVLHHNQTPQVVERGPYIYREVEQKIHVQFVGQEIQFYSWKTQTFDPEMTQQECAGCLEEDELTIINSNYFRALSGHAGDIQYTLHNTPRTVENVLREITEQSHTYSSDTTYGKLGQLATVAEEYTPNSIKSSSDTCFSFGCWLALNDSPDKTAILDNREYSNFTPKEMAGLYHTITDAKTFGASREIWTSSSTQGQCEIFIQSPELSYKLVLSEYSKDTGDSESDVFPACGMAMCLETFLQNRQNFRQDQLRNVTDLVALYLCSDADSACFVLPEDTSLRLATVGVIAEYILRHIQSFVLYSTVIKTNNFIETKPQCEWAVGTCAEWNLTAGHVSLVDAARADSLLGSRNTMVHTSVLNCYASEGGETNLQWRAYNRSVRATWEQFPNTTDEERSVQSHRQNVMPAGNLSACASYQPYKDAFDFFHPEYWRRVAFVPAGGRTDSGVRLEKLVFNASNLAETSPFVWEPGLQDMTGTNGYSSWVSLPHFLYADTSLPDQYEMSPSEELHQPYAEVELVTGEVWNEAWRYQHNVAVEATFISLLQRSGAISFNYTSQPIPAYWVDRHYSYNQEGKNDYHDRVGGLLNTSCGGLIGLCVVAGLVMIMGVLTATFTVHGGRVHPLRSDETREEQMSMT